MRHYDSNGAQLVGTCTREEWDRQQQEHTAVHFVAPERTAWGDDTGSVVVGVAVAFALELLAVLVAFGVWDALR